MQVYFIILVQYLTTTLGGVIVFIFLLVLVIST